MQIIIPTQQRPWYARQVSNGIVNHTRVLRTQGTKVGQYANHTLSVHDKTLKSLMSVLIWTFHNENKKNTNENAQCCVISKLRDKSPYVTPGVHGIVFGHQVLGKNTQHHR
jgi:hypothetical protein